MERKNALTNNTIRLTLYSAYFGAIAIPLVLKITENPSNLDFRYITLWSLVFALLVSLTENYLARLLNSKAELTDITSSEIVTSIGQSKLVNITNSHALDIKEAKSIYLMSDTLKSFADDDANLRALGTFSRNNGELKILLISPYSTGVSLTVSARNANNRLETEQGYSEEIISSLRRLSNHIPVSVLAKSLRFYNYPSFYASYIFDRKAFVTVFTYGRGGSSPSMYVKDGTDHDDFFDGIMRGFYELWESKQIEKLSETKLKKIMKS